MPVELVTISREELEEMLLRVTARNHQLTGKLFTDAEAAAFAGYSLESWQRAVRESPTLSALAVHVPRPGSKRPRRRWPMWQIVPLLQQGGEGVPQPPKRRKKRRST